LAEEVVQQTWAGVLEGIAHFEGQCRINTWIFGILIERARRIREARSVPFSDLRHSGWEIEPEIDLARLHLEGGSADSGSDRHDGTAERPVGREAMDSLKLAVHRLPPHLRAVVMLRDIEGLDSRGESPSRNRPAQSRSSSPARTLEAQASIGQAPGWRAGGCPKERLRPFKDKASRAKIHPR